MRHTFTRNKEEETNIEETNIEENEDTTIVIKTPKVSIEAVLEEQSLRPDRGRTCTPHGEAVQTKERHRLDVHLRQIANSRTDLDNVHVVKLVQYKIAVNAQQAEAYAGTVATDELATSEIQTYHIK